jgi:EAL domain-containing protein (putative c-di-GMP-specific phosphodiesterase class I)
MSRAAELAGRAPVLARWTPRRVPAIWAGLLVLLLAASYALVFAAGGTRTAWPHVFYLPVVLAAFPFGRRGAIAAAIVATVLCGPMMPLDTGTGAAQDLGNWTLRGAFFLAIGLVAGWMVDSLHRAVRQTVTEHVQEQIARAEPTVTAAQPAEADQVRRLIEDRRFHLVFQPIYSLTDGRLLAVEALARFETAPYRPPDVWFAQAARVGMESELDLAVIETAMRAARDLPAGVALHLNVTPPTLRDRRLLDLIGGHLDRRVVVEITEHAVIDDYARFDRCRRRLHAHGVELAVDDTGAGFASLRHIVRLAPEIIKLDISLSRNVRSDPVLAALAEALIQFCDRTGRLLVVEGIDQHADLVTWQRLGASAAQGYLLAKPGPLPVPERSRVVTSVRRRILNVG